MLEICFLVFFCKKLAAIARSKNRGSGWGALGALFWIGGEIFGAFVLGTHAMSDAGVYGYAILGAIVGALVAFVIVKSLPEIPFDNGLPQARIY